MYIKSNFKQRAPSLNKQTINETSSQIDKTLKKI